MLSASYTPLVPASFLKDCLRFNTFPVDILILADWERPKGFPGNLDLNIVDYFISHRNIEKYLYSHFSFTNLVILH